MSPNRRATDTRLVTRCFRFAVAPIVDGNSGRPSITRLLAIAGFVLLWHAVEAQHPISGTQLGMFTTIMAAAFGKSTFGYLLTRKQMDKTIPEAG